MGDSNPSEIDPQVVDDLRIVEQGCQVLAGCGVRTEFWESFTLLKIGREAYHAEIDRLNSRRRAGEEAKLDPAILQKIALIKEQLLPLARALREFLGKSSAGMLDGMKQDLALVFLMGSAKARQSVARWVSNPGGTADESTLRLKILSRLVDGYRRALLDARMQGAPPPASPDTVVRSMAPVTIKLKAEFVDDLRYVERGRRLFEKIDPVRGWDIICLILMQRAETRHLIDEMTLLKTDGKPGEFAGVAHRLRTMLKQVRAQFNTIALPLGVYFTSLFGNFGGDADELALAFLIASSQGRHRAKQWLDDPDLCRGEATASMNGLRVRAVRYLDAVKHLPQSTAAGT
jgi:hypothetical protein